MAKFTLTARQQKTLRLLIDKTIGDQGAVADATEVLAIRKSGRAACYSDLQQGMAEIGKPTGVIRNVTKDMEPDGSWAGKITVT